MKYPKFLQGLGVVLAIAFLLGCSVFTATSQPLPVQPGQPPQQQPPLQQPGTSGQQPGAPGPAPSELVLIDQMVTVAGGGGSAEVSFTASTGQRIQILLSASSPGMQPYGNLQYPDGTSQYNPPLNTAANGTNQVEINLNQNGQFTLTIFDGSNQGGTVSVKIIALK